MKKNIDDLLKGAKTIKDQATKFGKGAAKTATTLKGALEIGVATSKTAIEKASKMVNKDTLSQGLEATSKGMGVAATGIKTVAKTMEKASESAKKASERLKNKPS